MYGRSKSASPPSCTGALYRLHAEASGALADGCNINRRIDELVEKAGFELEAMDHFRGDGPAVLSSLYRGTATRD